MPNGPRKQAIWCAKTSLTCWAVNVLAGDTPKDAPPRAAFPLHRSELNWAVPKFRSESSFPGAHADGGLKEQKGGASSKFVKMISLGCTLYAIAARRH